jgi:hypothetical protein
MYSHTLFLFHTNGKELVYLRMNQKVQLPAGTYLCLQCADYKVIFNPEEMQAVPRRGIVIPEGGVFIPEDDCVYVRVDAIPGPIVYVSWPEVEDALREPSFVVHTAVVQGEDCFITWDFLFAFRSGPPVTQRVRGATHLRVGADGLIVEHRDYWDVAEELYEKLPLLGTLMRWLKRRAGS